MRVGAKISAPAIPNISAAEVHGPELFSDFQNLGA
jgi:hypothetical protein